MSLFDGNMSMCKIDSFGEESAMINNDTYPAMTAACPRLCTKVTLNRVKMAPTILHLRSCTSP